MFSASIHEGNDRGNRVRQVLKKLQAAVAKHTLVSLAALVLVSSIVGFMGVQAITGGSSKNVSNSRCDVICVALRPEGMDPSELAVEVGQFVQFNSADGQHHNIAEGDGAEAHKGADDPNHHDHVGGFVSGEFGPDEAWRVQFKKPGTYKLHDHHHPDQKILVIVYEKR